MSGNFLIVDGNSLMHRAFHALPLMDHDGIYTNAVYGFLSMLLKAIRDEDIMYLAVCFDEHAPTFRHTVYPEYKAGRKETPPELRQQLDTVLPMLDDMGIARFSLTGWEADDLLGTLAAGSVKIGLSPILLTGDRDALQLVDENVRMLLTKKGITDSVMLDPEKVKAEFGIFPAQVTDWKGLAGDASDNIKGVPGVGDKTAVRLLQEYGSLEKIIENAADIKGKTGERIAEYRDQALFCKQLATIRADAPVELDAAKCALPGFERWMPSLRKYHLFSLIGRINAGKADAARGKAYPDISDEGENGASEDVEQLSML